MKKMLKVLMVIASLSLGSSAFAGKAKDTAQKATRPATLVDTTLSPVYSVVSTAATILATVVSPFETSTALTSGGGQQSKVGSDGKVINQLKRNAGKPVPPSNGVETDNFESTQEGSSSTAI